MSLIVLTASVLSKRLRHDSVKSVSYLASSPPHFLWRLGGALRFIDPCQLQTCQSRVLKGPKWLPWLPRRRWWCHHQPEALNRLKFAISTLTVGEVPCPHSLCEVQTHRHTGWKKKSVFTGNNSIFSCYSKVLLRVKRTKNQTELLCDWTMACNAREFLDQNALLNYSVWNCKLSDTESM